MNYGMLVSSLASSLGEKAELKVPQKNQGKSSFDSLFTAERAKTTVDSACKDNRNTQKAEHTETRRDDTPDYIKANQNSENKKNDEIKKNEYKEDTGKKDIEKGQEIRENKETSESKGTEENKETKDVKETKETKPQENSKGIETSEKKPVDKNEEKNLSGEISKDVEDVLKQIAQLLGISPEELYKAIGLQRLNTDKVDGIKIGQVISEVTKLIDVKGQEKAEILEQAKELLKGLNAKKETEVLPDESDVKIPTSLENNKEQNVKNIKIEKIDDETVKNSGTSGTSTVTYGENRKPVVNQGKKDKTQAADTSVEGAAIESKTEKQKTTGDDKENDLMNNSEAGTESREPKIEVKVEGKAAEKIDKSFTAVEENIMQASRKAEDVDTAQTTIVNKMVAKTREEVIKQIIDKASVTITQDKAEMVINLKPDHLGKLSLKVATENGIITAQMVAENQQVKEIIETNLNVLREALEKQGISVQQFSVSVGQDSWKRAFEQNQSNNPLNSNKKVGNIRASGLSGFGYMGGQNTLVNQLWPDSTINFIA